MTRQAQDNGSRPEPAQLTFEDAPPATTWGDVARVVLADICEDQGISDLVGVLRRACEGDERYLDLAAEWFLVEVEAREEGELSGEHLMSYQLALIGARVLMDKLAWEMFR